MCREASIAIIYGAFNAKQAAEIQRRIEEFLFKNFPDIEFFFDYEII
jgi:hypothetical protein